MTTPEHKAALKRASYRRNRNKELARKQAAYDPAAHSARYYARHEDARQKAKAYYDANKAAFHLRARRREQHLQTIVEITAAEWQGVLVQYGYRCLACGSTENITKDHVVPISEGGRDHVSNVQPLCLSCNCRKGTKTIDYRRT